MRAVTALMGVVAGLAWPGPSTGQPAASTAPHAPTARDTVLAPVEVAPDHWVYPLLDRMAADGLLDGVWLPGRRPQGAVAIGAALDTAAARSGRRPGDGSVWAETAEAARGWLRDEHGLGDDGAGLRIEPLVGFRATDGPRLDPTAGLAGVRVRAGAGGVGVWLGPVVEVGRDRPELPAPRMGIAWRTGNLRMSASRGGVRFEPGASGGIVLGGAAALTRLELGMAGPARPPWILRHLGPTQLSVSVSRIGADTLGPAVALVAGAVRVQPHPALTVGIYRSALVAWTVDGAHPGLRDFLYMLGGKHTPFEDQKIAASITFRARLPGLTLVPYVVYGIEDSAGLDEDPAAVLGVWAPAIPVAGAPVGLRYEYTAFGEGAQVVWPWSDAWQPRGWYRHGDQVRGAYVDGDGDLLGHPLGGYGDAHRLEADAAVPGAGLLVTAGFVVRDRRGAPPNLLYDVLPGRSRGGHLAARLRAGRLGLEADVMVEDGEAGWSRTSARLVARLFLDSPAPGSAN